MLGSRRSSKSRRRRRPLLHDLQFLARASDIPRDASNGSGHRGPPLDHRGNGSPSRVDMADDTIPWSGVISWPLFWGAQWRHAGRRWWVWLFLPVFMTVTSWWWRESETVSDYAEVFFTFLWMVPLMIGMSVFQWWRMFAKTPQFKTPISGTISPSGFTAVGAAGRTEMTWQQFLKVKHSGDFLFLFVTSYSFQLLHRQFFGSEQDWQSAKELALASGRPSGRRTSPAV
jgi:hypothetical protein